MVFEGILGKFLYHPFQNMSVILRKENNISF